MAAESKAFLPLCLRGRQAVLPVPGCLWKRVLVAAQTRRRPVRASEHGLRGACQGVLRSRSFAAQRVRKPSRSVCFVAVPCAFLRLECRCHIDNKASLGYHVACLRACMLASPCFPRPLPPPRPGPFPFLISCLPHFLALAVHALACSAFSCFCPLGCSLLCGFPCGSVLLPLLCLCFRDAPLTCAVLA